jgi:hypothetical protein
MANNYLQFSATQPVRNKDELIWLQDLCERVNNLAAGEAPSLAFDPGVNAAVRINKRFGESYVDGVLSENGKGVWFFSEQGIDPLLVAAIIHEFYKQKRPKGKDVFVLYWAEYCDKLRENDFGGGAVVVTKDNIFPMTTGAWVEKKLNKLDKVQKRQKRRR